MPDSFSVLCSRFYGEVVPHRLCIFNYEFSKQKSLINQFGKINSSYVSSSGSAQFIQLPHHGSVLKSRLTEPLTDTEGFVFSIQACIAVLLNERGTCCSLTLLLPHLQAFPGRSDTHKQVRSIPQSMIDRHDHRLPGNNRPAVVVSFLTPCHSMILGSSLEETNELKNCMCHNKTVHAKLLC